MMEHRESPESRQTRAKMTNSVSCLAVRGTALAWTVSWSNSTVSGFQGKGLTNGLRTDALNARYADEESWGSEICLAR